MGTPSVPHLPLAKYASNLAFLTFLLISTTVFLPRSHGSSLAQKSSADRPEHPFLTPLTADPLRTMIYHVGGAGVVMAWWATRMRAWWFPRVKGEKRQQEGLAQVLTRMGRATVVTLLVSLFLTPLLFALGAQLDDFLAHTYLLALHLSLLLIFPVVYTFGIPSLDDSGIYSRYRLIKLLCEFNADTPIEMTITYPFVGTLIGAWLGAFVIPLDWDRPWQSWPLTPAWGSTLGFLVGAWLVWIQSARLSLPIQMAPTTSETPKAKKKSKSKVKSQ